MYHHELRYAKLAVAGYYFNIIVLYYQLTPYHLHNPLHCYTDNAPVHQPNLQLLGYHEYNSIFGQLLHCSKVL